MKALNMETVTLTSNGRENLTCFVFYVYEINSKIFSLIRYFNFGGVFLHLHKNIFRLFRGHLRLQSSFIQVIMARSFCSI